MLMCRFLEPDDFAFQPKRVLAIFGILAVLLAALAVAWKFHEWRAFNARPFAPVAWEVVQNRWGMCGDVLRNKLRVGQTRNEVVALLGESYRVFGHDRRFDAGGNRFPGSETLSYYLGSMHRHDDDFLYVHLDEAGRVIDFETNGY